MGQLYCAGITLKTIKPRREFFSTRRKTINSKDITLFVRQMASMLTAGIPIIQAFELIASGQTNLHFQERLASIKTDVESGTAPSDALRKYPRLFNTLMCNLIQAGEQSGTLDTMLNRIAHYREKTEHLYAKVKKALLYPTAVIIVAVLVTAILMVFVVPQFESLFQGFGADLPFMTRIIVQFSHFIKAYIAVFLGAGVLFSIGILQLHKRSEEFAYFIDKLLLRLPIIGVLLTKAIIARFSRTFATTFAAGLPIVDALSAVSGATGNRVYAQTTLLIRDSIATGQSLQTALKGSALFPPMALQMIAIGEASGTLENMLSNIADFYEAEVDTTVDNLHTLLEPVILIVLGLLIGGLIFAMYLPVFQLGKVI
ncbi:MAG: type II secretion system F family protein [Gammaproteobacteria bacterium]